MVTQHRFENRDVYLYEICGYGYHQMGTAESCEDHCDTRMRSSRKIGEKAIYQPPVEVLSTIRTRR